jgi:hypothetical protein
MSGIGLQINWVGPNLVDLEIIYSETLSTIRHRGPAHSGFFLPRLSESEAFLAVESEGAVTRRVKVAHDRWRSQRAMRAVACDNVTAPGSGLSPTVTTAPKGRCYVWGLSERDSTDEDRRVRRWGGGRPMTGDGAVGWQGGRRAGSER